METVQRTSPALVLLVAEDIDDREMLVEALELSGFLVAAYDDSGAAQRLLEDLRPDFVVAANDDRSMATLLAATKASQQIVACEVDCSFATGALRVRHLTEVPGLIRSLHTRQITAAAEPSSARISMSRQAELAIVVEDDPVLAAVLSGALADEGIAARVATTCAEARALLAQHPAAMLILDLTLPDGFGGDLLADAERLGRLPKALVVSAFALAEIVARRYHAELVRKPFELEAFLQAVERLRDRAPNERARAHR